MPPPPAPGTKPVSLLRWIVPLAIAFVLAAITGRLSVHHVNDSPSYLNYPFDSLRQAMLSIRPPVYPIFLRLAESSLGVAIVPLLQACMHAIACVCFGEELRRRGLSDRASLVAAFTVLAGCTATDHISTISTDAPAASLGVLTATLLMRTSRTGGLASSVGCGLAALLCIFARPAYLFLVPWVAIAGWMLNRCDRRRRLPAAADGRRGLWIATHVGGVILIWMSCRAFIVHDFSFLPFGHQNLSAVAAQLVSPDDMRRYAGDAAPATGELLRRVADDLERGDFRLPESAEASIPTLTLESQWGQINYGVIWPAAKAVGQRSADLDSETPDRVRVHRLIGDFNRTIIANAPLAYARWIVLAIRRSVWGSLANLAMHPLFLAMILVAIVWLLVRSASGSTITLPPFAAGWYGFAIIALTYCIGSVGLIILTSPPIGRFADAAAIFLPGLLASPFIGDTTKPSAPR
ncbi:hypothetical protein [Roseiconus lacunae]|uniref:hypothetical protein n=1 Tax=Roseiconus lacunae TaxID=2605694 RepID=UPI0011F2FD41